jgi:beta-lactam-binding protein with PASTA domain
MDLGSSLRRRRKNGAGWIGSLLKGGSSERGRMLITGGLLGVGGLLVGYVVATQVIFPPPAPPGDLFAVPDLRGNEEEGARLAVLDAGLMVGRIDFVRHPVADSGSVVAQTPLGGQLAGPGDSIRVTFSLGPERRGVPEVIGLRADWAISLLQASGFEVQTDSIEDEEPRGMVVSVDPEVGTDLAIPGEVTLTLSLGPPMVAMPRLLGLNEAEARDSLDVLGLSLAEVEEVFRFGRDQGVVVEQTPPADSLVEVGSRVRLSVGRGGGR